MIPLARLAAFQPDPQAGYVASLALARAQHDYLSTGEGARCSASSRRSPSMPRAGSSRRPSISAYLFLTKRQLARLQRAGRRAGRGAPDPRHVRGGGPAQLLRGPEAARELRLGDRPPDGSVPRALGRERHRAGGAELQRDRARVHRGGERAAAADRAGSSSCCSTTRRSSSPSTRALAAAESVAEGAQGLSSAADTLPEELGAEMAARLQRGARRDRGARRGARARGVARRSRSPTWRIASARRARSGPRCSPRCAPTARASEGGRPFDVREYESAAARIADASLEVRALVAELNGLDASGAAGARGPRDLARRAPDRCLLRRARGLPPARGEAPLVTIEFSASTWTRRRHGSSRASSSTSIRR